MNELLMVIVFVVVFIWSVNRWGPRWIIEDLIGPKYEVICPYCRSFAADFLSGDYIQEHYKCANCQKVFHYVPS